MFWVFICLYTTPYSRTHIVSPSFSYVIYIISIFTLNTIYDICLKILWVLCKHNSFLLFSWWIHNKTVSKHFPQDNCPWTIAPMKLHPRAISPQTFTSKKFPPGHLSPGQLLTLKFPPTTITSQITLPKTTTPKQLPLNSSHLENKLPSKNPSHGFAPRHFSLNNSTVDIFHAFS